METKTNIELEVETPIQQLSRWEAWEKKFPHFKCVNCGQQRKPLAEGETLGKCPECKHPSWYRDETRGVEQ